MDPRVALAPARTAARMESLPAAERARLLQQLREWGVDGEAHELEGLLKEASLDVRRALNLFFDRGCHVAAPDHGDHGSGDDAEDGHAAMGYLQQFSPQARSRDRRHAQRHPAETAPPPMAVRPVAAARPTAPGKPQPAARSAAPGGLAAEPGVGGSQGPESAAGAGRGRPREAARPWPSSAPDPPMNKKHALPVGPGKTAFRYTDSYGITYEVDAKKMTQLSLETGEVREIRRRKPRCWVVQVPARGGLRINWMPLPKEASHSLEGARDMLVAEAKTASGGAEGSCAAAKRQDAGPRVNELLKSEAALAPGAMDKEQVESALEAAFQEAARDQRVALAASRLVGQLASRQGLRCTPADARKAGLQVGSMALLQAVLQTDDSMQLLGAEVFDQHYASLKFNTAGRKAGLRSLLARGMTLGSHAPPSKLIRKVEADSVPLWESRYFDAMLRAYPLLPDCTVLRIRAFLSGAPAANGDEPGDQ